MDRYPSSTTGRPDAPWVQGSVNYQRTNNPEFGEELQQAEAWDGQPTWHPQNTFIPEAGVQDGAASLAHGNAYVDQKAQDFIQDFSLTTALPNPEGAPVFSRAVPPSQDSHEAELGPQPPLNPTQFRGGYYPGSVQRSVEPSYNPDVYGPSTGIPGPLPPIAETSAQYIGYGLPGVNQLYSAQPRTPGQWLPPPDIIQSYNPATGQLYSSIESPYGLYPDPPATRFSQTPYAIPPGPATGPDAGLTLAQPPRSRLTRSSQNPNAAGSTPRQPRRSTRSNVQRAPIEHAQQEVSTAGPSTTTQTFRKVSHQRDQKTHEAPETMPEYVYVPFPELVKQMNIRVPQPFGKFSEDTRSYEFLYDADGQLAPGKEYTAEQLQRFIARRVKDCEVDANGEKKFRIWIQTPPSQSTKRMNHSGVDPKCRLKGCLVTRRTINAGWVRAAFDDFSIYAEQGHKDPLKVAGVVHLYCLENKILTPKEMLDLHDRKIFRPDDRELSGESKNPIQLERESGKAVLDCFEGWFKAARRVVPDGFWSNHKQSLSWALNKYHVSHQPNGRALHRLRGKKEGDIRKTIDVHLGDLSVYIEGVIADRDQKRAEKAAERAAERAVEQAEETSEDVIENTEIAESSTNANKKKKKNGKAAQKQAAQPPRRRNNDSETQETKAGPSTETKEPKIVTEPLSEQDETLISDILCLEEDDYLYKLTDYNDETPVLPGSPSLCFDLDSEPEWKIDPNLQPAANTMPPPPPREPQPQVPKSNTRKRSLHDPAEGSSSRSKRARTAAPQPPISTAGVSAPPQTQPVSESAGIKRHADEDDDDLYEGPVIKKMRQ